MKVLVAARPYDLSEAPADAFVTRHLAMARLLIDEHDVSIVTLRPPTDSTEIAPDLRDRVAGAVTLLAPSMTRVSRLWRAGRRLVHDPRTPWELAIEVVARSIGPDLVLTIGPWLDYEYRVLFGGHPSIHVLEEDLTGMPEIAPQSRNAEILRSFEDVGRRRGGMRPTAVVVISEAESASAGRRFPRSRVVHIPYTLEDSDWPLASDESTGDEILVVGNLAQERNADGLVHVLNEIKARGLTRDLPIRLVSEAGLTPELDRLAAEPWITRSDRVEDVWSEYRRACAALVPATRATGFKTTVLQAWTAGCPVVCLPASARTLGPGRRGATLVGSTTNELIDNLSLLRRDQSKRRDLAARGFTLAKNDFNFRAGQQALLTLVTETADGLWTPR